MAGGTHSLKFASPLLDEATIAAAADRKSVV